MRHAQCYRFLRAFAVLVFALAVAVDIARAQEIGTVAAVEGTVEITRAGKSAAATIGAPVYLHDELRTGRPGRARVVFQDDSVLAVGDESQVVVDEQTFDPNQRSAKTLLRLLTGRLRAVVSEYYQSPGASYRIETPTAVSGVRGTEFVMLHDADAGLTEVVGIDGRVEVHSVLDRTRRGVFVSARELTRVAHGQFPTAPRRVDDAMFRQYLSGLEFIGGGAAESITIGYPLLQGNSLGRLERPEVFPAPTRLGAPSLTARTLESREAGVIDQPLSVLRSIKNNLGDLGVRF